MVYFFSLGKKYYFFSDYVIVPTQGTRHPVHIRDLVPTTTLHLELQNSSDMNHDPVMLWYWW